MELQRKTRSRRFAAPSILAALVVGVFVLAGCSPSAPETTSNASEDSIIADHGLEGLDAKQIIEKLDTMPVADRPTDLIASIRPDGVILTDGQERTASVPMPDDEFYVSFAPYVNQTHECYFHRLTTCRGELSNEEIQITVVDDATGETVIDQTMHTYDNGFAGLWLPRGLTATLTIQYDALTAVSTITTTSDEDPTCLTTLQLT